MRRLTDEEKKVAWAWASWTAGCIRDSLVDHEVERIDDEGFMELVTDALNDIAQANAMRVPATPSEGDPHA